MTGKQPLHDSKQKSMGIRVYTHDYIYNMWPAYLWRRAVCVGSEASCRADARVAAAPWARATVDRGLWLAWPLVNLLPLPEAFLWLAVGLKWAANARITLITDFRLPSTMSAKTKEAHVKSFPTLLDTVYTYRQIRIFDTSVLWTLSYNFNNTSWLQLWIMSHRKFRNIYSWNKEKKKRAEIHSFL